MHDRDSQTAQPEGAAGPVRLVAIVNSFNRRSLLEGSLTSLAAALRRSPFRSAIVVYEAGSTDGSIEWLEQYRGVFAEPEISILPAASGEDSSFAAGVNAGCRHAIARYPELQFLFLFETDNRIEGSEPIVLAARLLEAQAGLGAAGFTVTKRSGRPAGYGCSFPTAAQFLLGQQLTTLVGLDRPRWKAEPPFEGYRWGRCDVVYTSPLLVKRAAWEQTGGFDAASFPFSDSDLDWCGRAHRNGWELAVLEMKGVIHDNQWQASAWSSRRVLSFHRARLLLLDRHRHAPVLLLKVGLLVRHLLEFAALALASPLLSNPGEPLRKRWILIASVMRGYQD
jgi:GT2 family glycosyltransferase